MYENLYAKICTCKQKTRHRYTRFIPCTHIRTLKIGKTDLNCAHQIHHVLTMCCLEEAFKQGPNKLLQLWHVKPTTRPFCFLTHKLSPLSPILSPTYDLCSIKLLHPSATIKSIIIPGIASQQITEVDGQVDSGQWGHSDRQNETADR